MEKERLNADLVEAMKQAFTEHQTKCDNARREYTAALNQAHKEYAEGLKSGRPRLNRETAINKARDLLKVRERESGQTDTRPEITKAQTDIKAGISDRFGSIPGVIVSGI